MSTELPNRGLEHCPCGEADCPDLVHGLQAHYAVQTSVDGIAHDWHRLSDPFSTTVTYIGWRDLVRAVFRGYLIVRTEVTACSRMTSRVMALSQADENTLALPHVPCPTCTGSVRETTGLVCQTCGTDYGATAAAL